MLIHNRRNTSQKPDVKILKAQENNLQKTLHKYDRQAGVGFPEVQAFAAVQSTSELLLCSKIPVPTKEGFIKS